MTPQRDVNITVVVPVLNSMRYLPEVVPAVLNAGRAHGDVEYIFIDNGSKDGSREFIESCVAADFRAFVRERDSISEMRNFGAQHAHGQFLSFIDTDCLVGPSYFTEALADLDATGAAATGCEYDLPDHPGWIEAAWHDLHFHEHERFVEYLPAGNLFIKKSAFDSVGGFRADLMTGEDAELGQRLNRAGVRIHANPRVRAIHLGNPKTVRQFYRRCVWHGVGMFGTVKLTHIDKPTAMMFGQLAATIAGVIAVFALPGTLLVRAAVAAALQIAVPTLTVAYRVSRGGRTTRAPQGIFLYWLYYWARLNALSLIALRRARRYRK